MESFKKRWRAIPATIRKPIVLFVGLFIVILSPFTGVLPGPGGIPVFLIGVAILATEYEWARRIRDPILKIVEWLAERWRQHKIIGTALIIVMATSFGCLSYFLYSKI